jgi:hypothetical protein
MELVVLLDSYFFYVLGPSLYSCIGGATEQYDKMSGRPQLTNHLLAGKVFSCKFRSRGELVGVIRRVIRLFTYANVPFALVLCTVAVRFTAAPVLPRKAVRWW